VEPGNPKTEKERDHHWVVRAKGEVTLSCIMPNVKVTGQEPQPRSLSETETKTPIISIISLLLAVAGIFIMGIPLGILAIILAFVADYYGEKSVLKWVGGILGLIDIFLALIVLGMLLSLLR
jgi:hypothetical protein